MTTIGNGIIRGIAAGAAGTTALNTASGLDALLRGRPSSDVPEQLVSTLADQAGVPIPGDRTTRSRRLTALGPLSGTVAGLAVGAVPHLAYGITTYRALVALDNGDAAPGARPATLARAAALGAASGSRSFIAITALALTSRRADRGAIASRLGSRPAKVVTACLATGELAGDKLPSAPSRLAPPGIIPRVALAATAAAGMATRDGERPEPAAAVAAATALGSAALGVRLRALAARRFGSDLPGALIEDALAASLAWLGARRPTGYSSVTSTSVATTAST